MALFLPEIRKADRQVGLAPESGVGQPLRPRYRGELGVGGGER